METYPRAAVERAMQVQEVINYSASSLHRRSETDRWQECYA